MRAAHRRSKIGFVVLVSLSACSDAEREVVTWTALPSVERGGEPLFTRVEPNESGLRFSHLLESRHVLPYLYNGAGVAVGDYDGDDLPDVYLVSQDGPNKLFRQTAPWQFEDVTESAGGLDGGAAWGNAATFADIDGDGDLDLYVCNLEAPNLLYQNRGDGTFTEVGGKFGLAISAASTGASFADYDNDGDLDLYLLTNRVLGPTVPTELAQDVTPPADTRKGVDDFAPRVPPRLVDEGGRRRVEEKFRDLYFTLGEQVFAGGQTDRLFRQDGYGKFTDVSEHAGISDQGMGLSATWWDYDDDGHIDLYVANDLESPDVLYHNRGDGTFENVTERALPHTAYFGMGSDFGDVDGDGDFDFCVADMSSRTHYMSKMLMGNMGDRRWFLQNARPPQVMRNALYLNNGTDEFLEGAYLAGVASTDWTWAVRFADLDNDGLVDLYVTNGIPRFDNDPDANPEFRRLWRSGRRDEALDFARSLPPVAERNLALRNLGGLTFDDAGAAWGLDEQGVSQGLALADLDRDGDLDVVFNNFNAPASLYRNESPGESGLLVELVGDSSERHGVGARVRLVAPDGSAQIRQVTLARGYLGSGESLVHFGLGSRAPQEHTLEIHWPNGGLQTVQGVRGGRRYVVRESHDADGARTPSAAEAAPLFDATPLAVSHREADFDDYAVQPLLPRRLSRAGPGIAWGDADGDGRDDLWLGGAAGQPGTLWIASDDPIDRWAEMKGPWIRDAAREDLGAVWIDFDSDGDRDLYVVSGGVEVDAHDPRSDELRDRLYVNLDGRRFVRAPEDVLPSETAFLRHSGSCVAAADWDRDGDVDLFVGGHTIPARFPAAPPSFLLRNDGGRFVEANATCAPDLDSAGMVSSAVWTDVDGDGFVDLVVAAQWRPIQVWHNDGGERLVKVDDTGVESISGLWNGLATADLDHDGDIDLVATNLGLNSKYHASPTHPVEIFADDFGDPDGVLDIIEAKHGGEHELLPVRGKSCSTAAMPFLGDKFRTFDSFARATLPEIYTDSALRDAAYHVVATELASGVFVNDGSGRFSFRPLPKLAQIAPGFGIAISDFDTDGHLDIAIAQNSFAPEPETGRMDGGLGLVLRGLPTGDRFEPVEVRASGFSVRGDQKALGLADSDADGKPDLLLTLSDSRPVRFRNSGSGNSPFGVRLVGGAGNPDGYGASIAVEYADGTISRAEVHAGEGYLTQSCATAWFAPRRAEPTRIHVRWPDGSKSVHEPSRTDRTFRIRKP